MSASERFKIQGNVGRGFEVVRETFAENFVRRHELGAACCVYYHGEKAVDLWGGIRDRETGAPWEEDTMVVVHSASKGLAAMALAIAHSRGWLDYEERVCTYWPEFAQEGKARITVRQLLAHQAGLFAINEPVDRRIVADLDRLAVVLARQKPAWEPGTRQAYHALSLGFYEGELLRRFDPRHRSLGQFFQDEIASRLGLDVYIRLPEEIPDCRLARLRRPAGYGCYSGSPFASRLGQSIDAPTSIGHSRSIRAPWCISTNGASTLGILKCRQAVLLEPHGAGPFGDDGEWLGIFIFDCKTKEEVVSYLKTDPAIDAGETQL